PEYQVGPGDVLFINISGRPELGSPVTTGGGGKVTGSRVDGIGNIHLPLVGTVAVGGLTIGEVQEKLRSLYGRFLTNGWVVVEVAEFRSQPVYLLGQFRSPGTFYLDRPMTLLQGLALGGGLADAANLRSARLVRDGKTQPVDLSQLIEEGGVRQNTWLRAGDTIFVPDDRNQNVFVFGAVTKPGPVAMPNGRLNLPQALAAAGLGEVRGSLEYVRIIRSLSATRGELIVVDTRRPLKGEALPYPLLEGDIIYVPRSAVGNWNQAIQEILPSLQALSAILQPFVQIKFLTDED
ncbi:MAG: polysaccharide biosynthesis/export family protein, partial [Desulfuromonadales bacterium]|nr:polysaccharide biosynthesis/export family protein [Desulfuromonadales bacterium]